MKDRDIFDFGVRILRWTVKMQPLVKLTEEEFSNLKYAIALGRWEPGEEEEKEDFLK